MTSSPTAPWSVLAWMAVLLMAGCGNGSGEAPEPAPTTEPAPTSTPGSPSLPRSTSSPGLPGPGGDQLSLGVRHSEPLRTGAPVTWTLEVRHTGTAPVTLVFNSGQRGDVVLRQDGQERYRWSRGRFFTENVTEMPLVPGQAQSFDLKDESLGVEPGRYELVASLATRPAPGEVVRTVTVVP